jgi:hypothetical protein
MDRQRRHFILGVIGGFASAGVTSNVLAASDRDVKKVFPEEVRAAVEKEWFSTQTLMPKIYLMNAGVDKHSISHLSQIDFKMKRIMHVDGIVLSLAESAYILS